MWRRCMQRALAAPPGHYGEPAGSPELRTALANWVARSRGVSATPDELVVTSGAGHAVDLVAESWPIQVRSSPSKNRGIRR
jgi:GntR family transcriptional regulator/MocR family aminotransferase